MTKTINAGAEDVAIANLKPHPRNVNEGDFGAIQESIEANGFFGRIVVNRRTKHILAGNHRYAVAKTMGFEKLPVEWVDCDDETELRILLADNRTARLGHDNEAALAALLAELAATERGLPGTGFDGDDLDRLIADLATAGGEGEGDTEKPPAITLAERFGVPPFSVLDARQGYWQERKRRWLSIGIRSEVGRGGVVAYPVTGSAAAVTHSLSDASANRAVPGGSPRDAATLAADGKTQRGSGTGRRLTWVPGEREELDDTSGKNLAAGRGGLTWTGQTAEIDGYRVREGTRESSDVSGTSIFDPVLCELAYRWFCPPSAAILDPFAGGSVRGIVASRLGHSYTGIELRPEQVSANEEQAGIASPETPPRWIVGDSMNACALAPGSYDFVFSCPPYGDLEVYSDDPTDLSAMEYPAFLEAYRSIIAAAVGMLKPERFACFVVGDIRDGKGFYRNFPAETIAAFQAAGMTLYNEAILVTAVASLSLRAGRPFGRYRKLGKTHQNVLVFYKGDIKKIPDILGEVDFVEAPDAAGDDLTSQFGEVLP